MSGGEHAPRWQHPLMPCRTCGKPGTQLCAACKPTTKQRGYSGEHQRLRRKYQQQMDQQGFLICVRTGQRINPGAAWDLGHTDDRTGWTGPELARPNRQAGSKNAAKRWKI